MSERPGLGRVHDGFFGALFHGDPEAGCLFDQLVETLEAADRGAGRAIYLTGGPGDWEDWWPVCQAGQGIDGPGSRNSAGGADQDCLQGHTIPTRWPGVKFAKGRPISVVDMPSHRCNPQQGMLQWSEAFKGSRVS